jgi:hypothetical protein
MGRLGRFRTAILVALASGGSLSYREIMTETGISRGQATMRFIAARGEGLFCAPVCRFTRVSGFSRGGAVFPSTTVLSIFTC